MLPDGFQTLFFWYTLSFRTHRCMRATGLMSGTKWVSHLFFSIHTFKTEKTETCKRFKRTSRDPRRIAVQQTSLSKRLDSKLWHGRVKTKQTNNAVARVGYTHKLHNWNKSLNSSDMLLFQAHSWQMRKFPRPCAPTAWSSNCRKSNTLKLPLLICDRWNNYWQRSKSRGPATANTHPRAIVVMFEPSFRRKYIFMYMYTTSSYKYTRYTRI